MSWDEQKKHLLAFSDIEEKHLKALDYVKGTVAKNATKRAEAKIHNEKRNYLIEHELEFDEVTSGFYKTELVSRD